MKTRIERSEIQVTNMGGLEVCRGGESGRCVGEVSGRCVGEGRERDDARGLEGRRPGTRSALLSGYLGKSGHLSRSHGHALKKAFKSRSLEYLFSGFCSSCLVSYICKKRKNQ